MDRLPYICQIATFFVLLTLPALGASPNSIRSANPESRDAIVQKGSTTVLIGVGDSLTHGTMDATNNDINTLHAYLQLTADSLGQVTPLHFSQPLFDQAGRRVAPRSIPTNLGVDGADIFSLEGIEYYKRVGAAESFITESYLCNVRLARRLDDNYDKVLYPINVEARDDVSQIDAAIWLVNEYAPVGSPNKATLVFWAGNNDASTASLGSGGENPMFVPVPADLIADEVTPLLRFLLRAAPQLGVISYDSYTQATIDRNLTELDHFADQFNHLLDRLANETNGALAAGRLELLVLTLPHYSSIGYLFDSDDIEFYLRQIAPGYTVPPTFARVTSDGAPIIDPTQGDRISIFTFGLMYMLLNSGYSVEYVNGVLETQGQQRDAMVLSNAEQQHIASRIDSFNDIVSQAATTRGKHVHLVDIGTPLNNALNGKTAISISGRTLSRKWTRGGAFTLDGVHPGYTGQAIIANLLLEEMNARFGLAAPLYDLDVISLTDPYWDRDGDGWASGPDYSVSGLAAMLALLTDADDSDPAVRVSLPADVWKQMSEAILEDLLGIPALRTLALENGFSIDSN
jgi:hypothetical protein